MASGYNLHISFPDTPAITRLLDAGDLLRICTATVKASLLVNGYPEPPKSDTYCDIQPGKEPEHQDPLIEFGVRLSPKLKFPQVKKVKDLVELHIHAFAKEYGLATKLAVHIRGRVSVSLSTYG